MQAHDGPKRSYRHDRQQQQQQRTPEPEVSSRVTSCSGFVLQTKLVPIRVTIWLWVLCACSFAIIPARAGPRYSSRIVDTKSGAIRGVILELNSKHLEPVEVFKAVPYATPPIGSLRFEPPKKLPPWKGTKLADTFGSVCPQVRLSCVIYFVCLSYVKCGKNCYGKISPYSFGVAFANT
uniref:Carboxylesterase type B domain-containing protein n=1 Tax=Anopheles maculatus TaxID=74869 RepID=A0A182SAZ2_9DIPT